MFHHGLSATRTFGARLVFVIAVAPRPPSPLAQTPPTEPVVYSAEVNSIIHPVSAEFMVATIDAADRANAALVVFTLRTPGGLVDSTRDIVTRMLAARDAGRRLRRPVGGPGGLGRLHPDDCRRRRRDGAGHPHRRRPSGRRQRRSDGRDDVEEGGGGRRRLHPHAGRRAPPQRRARRAGGERQPRLHRPGSARRLAAADRPDRRGCRRPACDSSTAARSRGSTARTVTLQTARRPRRRRSR